MNRLQKVLLLAVVVGVSIMLLQGLVVDNQAAHPKIVLCNSKHSDVHAIMTVRQMGRLGNNIWEYMSLLTLLRLYERELNLTAYIPVTLKRELEKIFERINIQETSMIPQTCLTEEPNFLHINESFQCDKFFNKNKCPLTLGDYSARYKEVLHYGVDKIKNELRFHKRYVEYSHKFFNKIKTTLNISQENVIFVGMHYRGGDYNLLLQRLYNLTNRSTPKSSFYLQAMNYFKKKYKTVVFIFVTIDTRWLKKNLPFLKRNNSFLVVNPNRKDIAKDLVLLSQCNHSIISYGTFATTAALFSGGTTFAYDLGVPVDETGCTIAMGIAEILPNWHLLR